MTNKIKNIVGLFTILAFFLTGTFFVFPAYQAQAESNLLTDTERSAQDRPELDDSIGITKTADLNGDGMVGTEDLKILLSSWGQCPDLACPADLNSDGVVDGNDLGILLAAWTEDSHVDKEEVERMPERCARITDLEAQRECLRILAETEEDRLSRERTAEERLEAFRTSLIQRPTVSDEEVERRVRARQLELQNQERERVEMQRTRAVESLERIDQLQTETRNRVEGIREEVSERTITPEELRQRRAEIIEERIEGAKNGIVNAVSNMFRSNRNNADRLSNIADSIQSRIIIMDQEGLDISHAREHLASAESILSSAEVSLSDEVLQRVTAEIRSANNTAELREAFAEARELMVEVRSNLRDARDELREAVAELRELL